MFKVNLFLLLVFGGLVCLPFAETAERGPMSSGGGPRVIMYPQRPIGDKIAAIQIYSIDKANEVGMRVLFKIRELSNANEKVTLIKAAEVEVTAENADGQKLKVVAENPSRAEFGWGSNLWQQNEYRLFINKDDNVALIKIKWGGEVVVFKLSEGHHPIESLLKRIVKDR